MGTYTKNLKLETPSYTDNADIPALAKKNNEIIDSEMIKRANGLDYNEQTGVLQLTGNNSKVGNPIQIKNNLPVTSMASGTELKVNNYKQLIKFTKEGKTEQKSYTGKNILDYITKLNPSGNGLTNVINDDGSITTKGKPNLNYTYIINGRDITDELENGETYTLSQTLASNKLYAQIDLRKKDGTYTYLSANLDNRKHISFKVDKTIYENYSLKIQTGTISSWGDSSLTITNKYMLCKGTDTADSSFEPYVGGTQSPNPNYPQKIKNVRGIENLFKPTLATTVLNGITCAANRDGTYTLNGTATADTTFTIGTDKNLIIDKTYKFLGCPNGGSNTTYRMSWNFHNYEYGNGLISKKTSEARNVQITIFKGITASNLVFKPMFTEDTLSTYNDYVPYGSNYLQLKNVKKNLFDKNNLHFILGTVDVESITINNVGKSFYIKCKPNTTYTISRKIVGSRFVAGTTNGIPKWGEKVYDRVVNNAGSSITLTTSSNSNYLCVYYLINSTENENNILDNIQIEEGSESTSYEPYQEKIINVDLKGNNLCSNKDKSVNDELLVENGKAKINKKFGEYIFTGNENFSFADSNTRIKIDSNLLPQLANVYIPQPKTPLNITPSFCTHYILSSQVNVVKGSNKFAFSQWGNQKFIYFPVDYSTIEEFKAKLKSLYDSGNPVKVQYELAEPEVIDLGKVDFDLIENSTLTCEEESNMQIDYLTIDSNIFVQDSLDGSSSQKAPSINAVNEIISKLEARIIALENKNV